MVQNKVIKRDVHSGQGAVGIVSNSLTANDRTRGVYIGTSQSLDFSFDGSTWVTFQGCVAGTVLPLQVIGVRLTAGSSSPNAGDVVFIY